MNSDFDQNTSGVYPTIYDLNFMWISPDGNLTFNGELDANTETMQQVISDQNLIVYIRFDDENNTHFLSANGNLQDINKNNGLTGGNSGILGSKAGMFDGIDNFATLGNTASLLAERGTISVWAKNQNPAGVYSYLVNHQNGADTETSIVTGQSIQIEPPIPPTYSALNMGLFIIALFIGIMISYFYYQHKIKTTQKKETNK